MTAARLFLPLSLALLAGCASAPKQNVSVDNQSACPLQLKNGQNLILTLPSNPPVTAGPSRTPPAACCAP